MIKIDATIFYTYLDNAMVRRDFKVNGRDSILFNGVNCRVFAIQNAAYANIYGAHLGVNVNLPNNFEFSSRFNYQKGVEEMDNRTISRSRHVAPVFGINQLSYHHRKITLQLNHTYNGEISYNNLNFEERLKTVIYAKDEDGKPFSPAWYTINFNMMYNLSKNITISGALENISDQRYRPYSSGLVAGGRNFVLALNSKM
jgi:hemoglobin/transferrin/lactoferrin receptor protein